jgi:hypothetical protein
MQEIFDLIVFEHIVMIEEIEHVTNPVDIKRCDAIQEDLGTRLSRYKGEGNFYNWKNSKNALPSN